MPGSPWDEDKAMMTRWGLEGMQSFEQIGVAEKERTRSDISRETAVSGDAVLAFGHAQSLP